MGGLLLERADGTWWKDYRWAGRACQDPRTSYNLHYHRLKFCVRVLLMIYLACVYIVCASVCLHCWCNLNLPIWFWSGTTSSFLQHLWFHLRSVSYRCINRLVTKSTSLWLSGCAITSWLVQELQGTKHDCSLLERCVAASGRVHCLKEQYRMHENICNVVSKCFDNNLLRTPTFVSKDRASIGKQPFSPLTKLCSIFVCHILVNNVLLTATFWWHCQSSKAVGVLTIKHWFLIGGAWVTWAIYTQGQLLLWSSLIITGVVPGYK